MTEIYVPLGWWLVPAVLALLGVGGLVYAGSRPGMLGGLVEGIFSIGLLIAAVASLIVGLIK